MPSFRPMESAPQQTDAEPAVFTRAGVWRGMKLTLPFSVSAMPFGLAYGAAAAGVGGDQRDSTARTSA